MVRARKYTSDHIDATHVRVYAQVIAEKAKQKVRQTCWSGHARAVSCMCE